MQGKPRSTRAAKGVEVAGPSSAKSGPPAKRARPSPPPDVPPAAPSEAAAFSQHGTGFRGGGPSSAPWRPTDFAEAAQQFLGADSDDEFDEELLRASHPKQAQLVDASVARLEARIVLRLSDMGTRLNAALQFIAQSQQKPTATIGPATIGPGHTETSTPTMSANAAQIVRRITVRSGDRLP
jgi:hypothetical protein